MRYRNTARVLTALALLAATPTAAAAYEVEPYLHCTGNGYKQVRYTFEPGWSAADQSAVAAGFQDWNQARFLGNQVVNVVPFGTGQTGYQSVVVKQGLKSEHSEDCTEITLDTDRYSGVALTHLARHEMGHILGLWHTGKFDNFNGELTGPYPTMSNVCSVQPGNASYTATDEAALMHRHAVVNGIRRMHANPEMDRDITYWSTAGGGTLEGSTSGRVKYSPSTVDSAMYQIVSVASADTAAGSAPIIRANASVAAAVLNTGGTVWVQLVVRRVWYGGSSPDGCAPEGPSGKYIQSRTVGGWSVPTSTDGSPLSAQCSIVQGSVITCPTKIWLMPDDWDAADLKVRLYSHVSSGSGSLVPIYVHALTAERMA